MPTTATDILIPPGGGDGRESQAVAAAAASQREMSDETLRRSGMGALGVAAVIVVLGTDDRRQPVVNDPITLHGDEVRCVYGPFFL